ncbi:MAG TPA: hypothetical protein VJ837_06485, partial [Candidatus Paceibacterota bacterium]|nr:hypothetical protein [Candidatus Paceibacterota bacterium]
VWRKGVEQDDTRRVDARLTSGGNSRTNPKDQRGNTAESGRRITLGGEANLAVRGLTDHRRFGAPERGPRRR